MWYGDVSDGVFISFGYFIAYAGVRVGSDKQRVLLYGQGVSDEE